MAADLRALVHEALTTTPSEALRGDKDGLDLHATAPWRQHGQHRFHVWCALCQGEADTLADAVVAALEKHHQRAEDAEADAREAITHLRRILGTAGDPLDQDAAQAAREFLARIGHRTAVRMQKATSAWINDTEGDSA